MKVRSSLMSSWEGRVLSNYVENAGCTNVEHALLGTGYVPEDTHEDLAVPVSCRAGNTMFLYGMFKSLAVPVLDNPFVGGLCPFRLP